MPLPFSFFSQRRPEVTAQPAETAAGGSVFEIPDSWNQVKELPTPEPAPLPIAPVVDETLKFREQPLLEPHSLPTLEATRPASGLAALAMTEAAVPTPPPPNRRLTTLPPPGPAVAASLARAAQAPGTQTKGAAVPTTPEEDWNLSQVAGRATALLRQEMQGEMDQVKSDLFGAAMGVSALKDRLDGLEALVIQAAVQPNKTPPPPTREDVSAWAQEWLDARLPAAVEAAVQRVLAQTAQQATAALSSAEFFRIPVRPRPPGHLCSLLDQPPLILSTSPL